jgi:hypothetical protein
VHHIVGDETSLLASRRRHTNAGGAHLPSLAPRVAHALGSVRRLADPSGVVALAESYEPLGETLTSTGTRTSTFKLMDQLLGARGEVRLKAMCPGPNPRLGSSLWRT